MVQFLPEEAVVLKSAANTRENIRTPDLLSWKTAEFPAQADDESQGILFLQGFIQNLDFILEYFTKIGDLLFSLILYSTHVPFLTQTLFQTSYLENVLMLTTVIKTKC